jgi:hypothetical protein
MRQRLIGWDGAANLAILRNQFVSDRVISDGLVHWFARKLCKSASYLTVKKRKFRTFK